jgi:hypothetical protein
MNCRVPKQSSRNGASQSAAVANVGRAHKTTEGRNYKEVLHDDIFEALNEWSATTNSKPRDVDELASEAILAALTGFSTWLGATPILQKNNTGKSCDESTTKQYFGAFKEGLKEASAWCSLWDSEVAWYPDLLANLGTASTRRLFVIVKAAVVTALVEHALVNFFVLLHCSWGICTFLLSLVYSTDAAFPVNPNPS